jgi:hypothetical protein
LHALNQEIDSGSGDRTLGLLRITERVEQLLRLWRHIASSVILVSL